MKQYGELKTLRRSRGVPVHLLAWLERLFMKRAYVCWKCDSVTWSEKHFALVPYHLTPYHQQTRVWWTCIECVNIERS